MSDPTAPKAAAPPHRSYRAELVGFAVRRVYARALNRSAARYIVAAAFADAGFGSVGDGLGLIRSCVLDPSADARRVVGRHGRRPGEGLLSYDPEDQS